MSYIIVFRNSHREPHISLNSHNFKEDFSSYEAAKEEAERIIDAEGPKSEWYFDYQIYQEVED